MASGDFFCGCDRVLAAPVVDLPAFHGSLERMAVLFLILPPPPARPLLGAFTPVIMMASDFTGIVAVLQTPIAFLAMLAAIALYAVKRIHINWSRAFCLLAFLITASAFIFETWVNGYFQNTLFKRDKLDLLAICWAPAAVSLALFCYTFIRPRNRNQKRPHHRR